MEACVKMSIHLVTILVPSCLGHLAHTGKLGFSLTLETMLGWVACLCPLILALRNLDTKGNDIQMGGFRWVFEHKGWIVIYEEKTWGVGGCFFLKIQQEGSIHEPGSQSSPD